MIYQFKQNDKTFFHTELAVKHYKDILKCTYGEISDPIICIKNLIDIVQRLLIESSVPLKELNIVEFLGLVINIRNNSMGNTCDLVYKDDPNTKIELKLEKVIEILSNVQTTQTSKTESNLEFVCSLPSLNDLIYTKNLKHLVYISDVIFNKQKLTLTLEHKEKLFNHIEFKLYRRILTNFQPLLDNILKVNLFSMFNNESLELKYNYSPSWFVWFIKLIFSESLTVFYNNIFNLSYYSHLDASYVESCTVGEYMYFVNLMNKNISSSENN